MRAILLGLVGLLFLASPAFAHGSHYRERPPFAPVPPWLREPTDPTPPPPPPPASAVPVRMPAQPKLPADDWFFWWQMNSPRFETVKWSMYHSTGGPTPLFVTSFEDDPRRRLFDGRQTEKAVVELARPALRRVLDGKTPGDDPVRAAALLAYGKLACEEAHARRLLSKIDAGGASSVREAGLIALGLPRRSWTDDTFPGALLDEVRARLRAVVESPKRAPRDRGAAALAIGLLADQPTVVADAAKRRAATRRLMDIVLRTGFNEEPATSALIALGRHAPADVSPETLDALRRIVRAGRLTDARAHTLVLAEAARALGRLGDASDVALLAGCRSRSSVLGLSLLAERIEGAPRAEAIVALRRTVTGSADALAKGLALLGLAEIAASVLDTDGPPPEWATGCVDLLLGRVRHEASAARGHAVLGLGIVSRSITDDSDDSVQDLRECCQGLLSALLDDAETPPRVRAAACIALGLGGFECARLQQLLADESLDLEVRASAAWGLGLPRWVNSETLELLASTVAEGEPALRRRAVRALAVAGQPALSYRPHQDIVDRLLVALEGAETAVERVDLVILLARFADHRAIPPLVALMEDQGAPSLLRALAASALGSIGDLQLEGAFDSLRRDAMWWARSTLLRDVYRYL